MELTMAGALNAALRDSMREDDSVVVYGEDVGRLGGVFRITDGLQAELGADRCFDTPVAESGIIGTAIGMAIYGLRPVVEMQFDGFSYPAHQPGDQPPREVPEPHPRQGRAPDRHACPVRRRDRRGGAPFGEPRDLLRAYRRAHRRVTGNARGRVRAPAHVDRAPGPGHLPRTQAAVLAQGGSRPTGHGAAHRTRGRPSARGRPRRSSPMDRWSPQRWTRRRRRPRAVGTSRSSTCAR